MREIEILDEITVAELAELSGVRQPRLIRAAFTGLGKMLTVLGVLSFEDSKAVLASFGSDARRGGS